MRPLDMDTYTFSGKWVILEQEYKKDKSPFCESALNL